MFKPTTTAAAIPFVASSVPSAVMAQAPSNDALQTKEPARELTATSHRSLLHVAFKTLLALKDAQFQSTTATRSSLRGGGGVDKAVGATRALQYEDATVPGVEIVDFKTALLTEIASLQSELEAVNGEAGMEQFFEGCVRKGLAANHYYVPPK